MSKYTYPEPTKLIIDVANLTLQNLHRDVTAQRQQIMSIQAIRSPIKERVFVDLIDSFRRYDRLGTDLTLEKYVSIGYHGTNDCHQVSIAINGLIGPGDPGYKMANGNACGAGVYVSDSIGFANGYNKGLLLVAAIVKGICQPYSHEWRNDDNTLKCDSVTSAQMIVLRGSCQVLPLFTIKIGTPAIDITKLNFTTIPVCNYPSVESHSLGLQIKLDNPGVSLEQIIALIEREHNTNVVTTKSDVFNLPDIEAKVRELLDIFDYEDVKLTN